MRPSVCNGGFGGSTSLQNDSIGQNLLGSLYAAHSAQALSRDAGWASTAEAGQLIRDELDAKSFLACSSFIETLFKKRPVFHLVELAGRAPAIGQQVVEIWDEKRE
jgi:hypothetical protein